MLIRDIQSFIEILRREGELVDIQTEVDPNLEIAEVHRRVIAANGPALLFHHPKGYSIPVVTNLFGTPKRIELAFGRKPKAFVETAVSMLHEMVPPTVGKLWGKRAFFRDAMNVGMKPIRRAPVLEVVDTPPRIDRLPMLKSWPQDGGDFVTWPLVYTEHPDNKSHNLGMYRIQRHSPQTTGMHWQIGKGGGFHHHIARERGEDLPVTLFVGGPPALILSAIAPLPENVPELILGSLLAGERLRTCDNPAGPHRLLADCEFAFIGHVKPNEVAPEGPFGDHYGYYSYTHDYPVFNVNALAHRANPVWPATVVGKPRQEDLYIGDYLQELLSPIFPVVMPNVRDLWSYGETGYHSLAGAVVTERYGREAMQAAFRILGEGQLSLTKFLWVVDGPVDLRDPKSVLPYLLERFRPETDLYVLSNLSMDTLDYTGPGVNLGSKGVMIGVGEPWRSLPKRLPDTLPGGVTRAAVFCPGVLLLEGPRHEQDADFLKHCLKALSDWPLVILCEDPEHVAASSIRFLWTTFTRFEPANDLHATDVRVERHHLVYSGAEGIDARTKKGYAEELFVDPETKSTVDTRWTDYFPDGNVEMGDADTGHLDEV